jgi:hypothetical protein
MGLVDKAAITQETVAEAVVAEATGAVVAEVTIAQVTVVAEAQVMCQLAVLLLLVLDPHQVIVVTQIEEQRDKA